MTLEITHPSFSLVTPDVANRLPSRRAPVENSSLLERSRKKSRSKNDNFGRNEKNSSRKPKANKVEKRAT